MSGPSARRGVLLGLLLIVTSLTRPEGVLMSGFILLALLVALGKKAGTTVGFALSVLVPLGTAYFVWRYHYFGYLLPNPFYLKGGGHLHPDALGLSVNNVCLMLAPVLPFFLVELFSRHWRRAVVGLTPVVGFTCIWILLSPENNHFMRFQYCALPIALLSLPYASHALRERIGAWELPQSRAWLVCGLLLLFSWQYWSAFNRLPSTDTALYNIALALNDHKDKGYTIASTEAGILPFFSQWRAIDLYGLNDAFIVHNPDGLTVDYLAATMPAVILVHKPDKDFESPGFRKAEVAVARFTAEYGYSLAAVWAYNACSRHLWYVRQGLPETPLFTDIVNRSPYFLGGVPLSNVTGQFVPEKCVDAQANVNLTK